MANVVISNVPGPQLPLYRAGARMAGIYPLSIVRHGIAFNITVQSYRGPLCVGLMACRRALPEVKELADLMGRAMDVARALPVPAEPPAATAVAPVGAPAHVAPDTPAAAPNPKKGAQTPRPRAPRAISPAAGATPMAPVVPVRKRTRRDVAAAA